MSAERLPEIRASLRHRRHRDSSCPANCQLHPASSAELPAPPDKVSDKSLQGKKSASDKKLAAPRTDAQIRCTSPNGKIWRPPDPCTVAGQSLGGLEVATKVEKTTSTHVPF
jgi:hypothetical protein